MALKQRQRIEIEGVASFFECKLCSSKLFRVGLDDTPKIVVLECTHCCALKPVKHQGEPQ